MEYLKTIKEIDQDIKEDDFLIQDCLFGKEYIETCLDSICPICKVKQTHLNWWTCKECSHLPIDVFNKEMTKYFKA